MEISEYKTKKSQDIISSYNLKINNEKSNYEKESLNIKKNFLLSQFQKGNMIKQLDERLKNSI